MARLKDIRRKSAKKRKNRSNSLKDLFITTRSELRAIWLLSILLCATVLFRWVYLPRQDHGEIEITHKEESALRLLRSEYQKKEFKRRKEKPSFKKPPIVIRPHTFDPNKTSASELLSMGLPEFVTRNWTAYLDAGAVINDKADIARIFGMETAWAEQLSSYADFPELKHKRPEKNVQLVEINTADSATLTGLPGIGPVYARRIIAYRELLGGFAKPVQLLEVYGMDSSRFSGITLYIISDTSKIRTIDVNTASFGELLKHPLIDYELAYSISEYKRLYGILSGLDEIQNADSDSARTQLLLYYLHFGD